MPYGTKWIRFQDILVKRSEYWDSINIQLYIEWHFNMLKKTTPRIQLASHHYQCMHTFHIDLNWFAPFHMP